MNVAVGIISFVLILFGTISSMLPYAPGLGIAWLGLFIFAAFHHFQLITGWGLLVFGLLILLTIIVDTFAPAIVAQGYHGSKYGAAGAFIGTILGVTVLGPIGIFVGPCVGAFCGEMYSSYNKEHAFRAATGALAGLLVGTAFKVVVGFSMLIYFSLHLF